MKFRSYVSFNTHDTKTVQAERTYVEMDVRRRCELALRGVLRNDGISPDALTDHINTRRNACYSVQDIKYALKRLSKEGLIQPKGKDQWVGTKNALSVWKQTPKEWI